MCCEDIQIARRTKGNQVNVTAQAADAPFLSGDPHRYALIIFPASAGDLWVSMRGAAAIGNGGLINATTGPLYLNLRDHGNIVTMPMRALATVAPTTIACWIATLEGMCEESKQ